jgi:hypothetical protein
MTATEKAAFATWLHGQGYRSVRDIGAGRYACLRPLIFTWSLIVGRWGDTLSLDDAWCYHTQAAALAALDAWNGEGEPAGWHRHPLSGRRVIDGAEVVAP